MNLLYLSRADIESLNIPMPDVIAVVEEAFRRKALGETEMTSKAFITTRPEQAGLMSSAAYIGGMDAVGIKWLGWSYGNRHRGLPLHTGLVVLNDPETSLPIAVMDAAWVTAMRTAAASGVAMKYLGPKRAAVGAVVGCGVEGRSNLAAMRVLYPEMSQLRCYDISDAALQSFVAEARARYDLDATAVAEPRLAVEGADVVVTAGSTGSMPLLKQEWLKRGAIAAAVDLFGAWGVDLAASVDKVVVDDYEKWDYLRAVDRLRDLPKRPYGELGEVVAGLKPGRETPEERAMSVLAGIPIDDVAAGHLVYTRARAQGVGTELPL
jgi:ornithine cyclodeaminase/alanine dehydrogenase-like protein (mu-crystallin family)